jgi:hypothetical protein
LSSTGLSSTASSLSNSVMPLTLSHGRLARHVIPVNVASTR